MLPANRQEPDLLILYNVCLGKSFDGAHMPCGNMSRKGHSAKATSPEHLVQLEVLQRTRLQCDMLIMTGKLQQQEAQLNTVNVGGMRMLRSAQIQEHKDHPRYTPELQARLDYAL